MNDPSFASTHETLFSSFVSERLDSEISETEGKFS